MCGICGYISNQKFDYHVIKDMNNQIIHRGPDSDGFLIEGNVSLAMRRLKIIDLSTGDQPIFTKDRNHAIIFNGEIYNYKELKEELLSLGCLFDTLSDTEVILQGYVKWGLKVFSRLNGMFGIAIYDKIKQKVILARDRLGIKPLYYYNKNDSFVFGSEIKSILKYPKVEKKMSTNSLYNLLSFKYIPSDESFFEDINKILPGTYMEIDFNGVTQKREKFWNLVDIYNYKEIPDYNTAKKQLYRQLKESVRKRMISDVPFGAFLSGGIDSGIIVGLMKELSNSKVKTFTIGFDEKSFNELKWAKKTASFHNTEHYEEVVKPKEIISLIKELVYFLDEPIGDYSIIPTYYVSKYTRQQVTVALSGIGADELFAGYERYWIDNVYKINKYLPTKLITNTLNILPVSGNKKSITGRLKKVFNDLNSSKFEYYQNIVSLYKEEQIKELLSADFQKNAEKYSLVDLFNKIPNSDFIKASSFVDIQTILRDDYLVKDDRMSMANSLEVRVPFLDHELVELSFKIKSGYKLKSRTTKYILKDTFKDYLPKDIINRGKYGFEAPFSLWAKKELKDEILEIFNNSKLVEDGIINKSALLNIFEEHQKSINNNGKLIFTLLTLEFWYQLNFCQIGNGKS